MVRLPVLWRSAVPCVPLRSVSDRGLLCVPKIVANKIAEISEAERSLPGARGLCRRRLERVLEIDTDAAAVKRQIAALVEASGSTLTQMHGVGPVVAAR